MTEKYRLTKHGTYLYDNELKKKIYDWVNNDAEIVDLLNILYNENISLKRDLDNIYLLIGRGDWSGLVDYLMNNEPEVQYSIEEILEDLE